MNEYAKIDKFIKKHFSDKLSDGSMRIGRDHAYESGYFDIIRFFGDSSIDPKSVTIEHRETPFKISDEKIAKFSSIVEAELRSEGRLYDGPMIMKLVDYSFEKDNNNMLVQPAHYGDQAGTCFALDRQHALFEKDQTLREYYKRNYPSHKIKENPLALCLGICGLLVSVYNGNKQLLIVHRSSKLASMADSIGPSAAGSVDYSPDYNNLLELIEESMSAEVSEELNLSKDQYNIIPLAFAREIHRGESPQLFCLIETDLTPDEIVKWFEQIPIDKREFDSFEFIELNRLIKQAVPVNHEALANYYLVEEYYDTILK